MSGPHSNFFSSLKQVEKRLKLELHNSPHSQTSECDTTPSTTQPLSPPIFIHTTSTQHHTHFSNQEDSEIPVHFLSNSSDFTPTHEPKSLPDPPLTLEETNDVDEIGNLIELLGLSDFKGADSKVELGLDSCCSCHCGSGFLGKIAGVKGPKCKKEMGRLDGWITYFRTQKIEPFRLAHLLLGKAAFVYGDVGGEGFGGVEFPSTVEDFLRRDPPKKDACLD